MSYLRDTNTIIYYLDRKLSPRIIDLLGDLVDLTPPEISVMTELELLGFRDARPDDLVVFELFVARCNVIELGFEIKKKTTEIRRSTSIKLPDAIIAATAIVHDFTLLTRNVKDFQRVGEIIIKGKVVKSCHILF